MRTRAFMATICLLMAGLQTAAIGQSSNGVILSSQRYQAKTAGHKQFKGALSLKPHQEKRNLMLTVDNGASGKPAYDNFKIAVGGQTLVTEKDLQGKSEAVVNVTGRLPAGGGELDFEATGPADATLSWKLSTSPIWLDSVTPNPVQPGQPVVLQGHNFSTDETQDAVLINDKPAEIISASANSITATVPTDVQPGKVNLKVLVASIPSKTLPLVVNADTAPVLLGTDFTAAPAKSTLTISGKNFSANLNDNKVFFRDVEAQVTAADADHLTVVVPNLGAKAKGKVAISVVSHGIKSENLLPFSFGKACAAQPVK